MAKIDFDKGYNGSGREPNRCTSAHKDWSAGVDRKKANDRVWDSILNPAPHNPSHSLGADDTPAERQRAKAFWIIALIALIGFWIVAKQKSDYKKLDFSYLNEQGSAPTSTPRHSKAAHQKRSRMRPHAKQVYKSAGEVVSDAPTKLAGTTGN